MRIASLRAAALGAAVIAAPAGAATLEVTFTDYYSAQSSPPGASVTLRFATPDAGTTVFTATDLVDRYWTNAASLASNATYFSGSGVLITWHEQYGPYPASNFDANVYLMTGSLTVNPLAPAANPTMSYGFKFIDYWDPAMTLDDRAYWWTYTSGVNWRSYWRYDDSQQASPSLVTLSSAVYDSTATSFAAAAPSDVPVPAAGGLLALALGALGLRARRRR
ncbi:hypothetical protein ACQ5SO_09090 [Rhodovulum sp. DZ06]|uniref:hypothetical protein n=1 Tax=Rhodovulum sp. DZ06 TaxID=3425126 RepID=UPI003D3382A6